MQIHMYLFTGGSGKVYRRLLLFQPPPVLVLRIDRFRMVHIMILHLHFAVFFLVCPLERGNILFLSIFLLRSSNSNGRLYCFRSFIFSIIFFFSLQILCTWFFKRDNFYDVISVFEILTFKRLSEGRLVVGFSP